MAQTHSTETLLADIRDNCLGTYRSQPGRLDGDIGNESENQSNYHGRFIYELIQNADDVLTGRADQRARFELHEDRLYMAHTGEPFTEEDVRALCILGLSSKSDEHATIGQKGRGFTSVLEITDTPAAYSTTYDLQFDRQQAYETITSELDLDRSLTPSDVPVLTMPFPPTERTSRVKELLADDSSFTTVFEFKLRDDRYETIKQRLADLDPQIMLFLRCLERLEISIDGDELVWELQRSPVEADLSERVTSAKIDISCDGTKAAWGPAAEEHHYIRFRKTDIPVTHRAGLEGPQWDAVELTEIGTAFRYEDREGEIHLQPFERTPEIHLFLPTEEPSPFPLLINGAFKPDSSRTGIPLIDETDGYNAFLLDELANLLATDVLEYATTTGTTVDEFLACLNHQEAALSRAAPSHLASALADELWNTPFLPVVDGELDCQIGGDRYAPADLFLPYSHENAQWLGTDIARLFGCGMVPSEIDPQTRRFPAAPLLEGESFQTLIALGVDRLNASEVPSIMAAAPAERTTVRSFEEVSLRREVDPVLNVLIGIESVTSDTEVRSRFVDACRSEAVFPIAVNEDDTVDRVSTTSTNLLFPPEDFDLTLGLEGVQFLAPGVYQPSGWTRPRGEHGDSDEFQAELGAIWDIDPFDFQSFAQAVILPRLPRSRSPVGETADLESLAQLRVLRELAGATVKAESPLAHQPRKRENLYRLCMLPVPTKEDDWVPAYQVYIGPEWFDDIPDWASPLPILEAAHGVDPPVLAPPETVLTEAQLAAAADDTDAGERTTQDEWVAFFRWLGVTPHLRLTPLFDPVHEREYSATADLGRPSEDHPTLGALSQSTWNRFQHQLREAVESSTANERNHLSIYRANRLEFWPAIRDAAKSDAAVAINLFCHLAYWWEVRYSDATTVGVGGHSVSARQVADRNKGIPNSTERNPLGRNLWLWELRESEWCPSIYGRYQPTRVWQRSDSLVEQFTIDQQGTVLLPVLHTQVEELLGDPPLSLCQALGIRATIASSDFEPADAKLVCELLASWTTDATDKQIENTLPTIRTAYRELAVVMPSRNDPSPPDSWQDTDLDLASTPVLCEVASGEYGLRDASEAYYVTSRGDRQQIPLSDPPVFVLQENEAGAYGRYFDMQQLKDAVESVLPELVDESRRADLTTRAESYLAEREAAIRCLLSRERPSQRQDDADALERFMEELTFVETLEVEYRLGEHSERTTPLWFIQSPEQAGERRTPYIHASAGAKLEDVVETVAKALCEFLEYPNIGDVVLILRTTSELERKRTLKLLDAPRDLLNPETGGEPASDGVIGLGNVGDTIPDPQSGTTPDIPTPGKPSESDDATGSGDSEGENDRALSSDPAERLWDPDDLTLTLADGTEIEGAGVDDTLIGKSGGGGGSSGGGSDNGPSSSPAAGGIREAINQTGREIAYSFECSRFKSKYGISNPEKHVFYVDDKSHIERARRGLKSKPVLDWLTRNLGLDWTYPGFDILTVHPDSTDGNPKVDRLVEVKSLLEDGSVDISLNEWYTANISALQEDYYLYVVADLELDSASQPFIRTVKNPSAILQANPREQRSISLEVNTKRFTDDGVVKEFPLRGDE